MSPDAVLYLVTQPYLSTRRFRALADGLIAATTLPATVARMERTGAGVPEHLDALVAAGARAILVQPVGLPFSDSLTAWLPGALAHWLEGQEGVTLRLAPDQAEDAGVIEAVARAAIHAPAREIGAERATLDNPGWEEPPAFRHHILLCNGPRCTWRGAGSLQAVLERELRAAGVMGECLIVTTGCLFPCNRGPVAALYPEGRWHRLAGPEDVALFARSLATGTPVPQLVIHEVQT